MKYKTMLDKLFDCSPATNAKMYIYTPSLGTLVFISLPALTIRKCYLLAHLRVTLLKQSKAFCCPRPSSKNVMSSSDAGTPLCPARKCAGHHMLPSTIIVLPCNLGRD